MVYEKNMSASILITARLKSTRLKEKVLKDIYGRPMLWHMINRLRLAKIPEKIIICTSTDKQDDRLCELAKNEGIDFFRGHPDDVLLRMRDAAAHFNVDTIVSCTADNPFVDPIYIDKVLSYHLEKNSDFSAINGLPFGVFSYVLNQNAVERACKIKNQINTEVWGGYFTQTGIFNCNTLNVSDPSVRWPELRLTVDTQEDFDLINKIFYFLYKKGEVFTLKEVVALCRDNPGLVDINSHIKQAEPIPIKLNDNYGR